MRCRYSRFIHFASHDEFTVTDVSRLAPIKEQCPEHITFEQIKIVIAILHRRFGMQVDNDSDILTASAAVNFTLVTVALLKDVL